MEHFVLLRTHHYLEAPEQNIPRIFSDLSSGAEHRLQPQL